jgi:lipoic acid synthetase
MGDICTRGCKFCNVKTGNPKGELDENEPQSVAHALSQMKLKYVVLTSVDRDDLPDGGANHFALTVEAIKRLTPHMMVEVLVPDFAGNEEALKRITFCGADVLAHNVETTRELTRPVRDGRCDYDLSLNVLKRFKELNHDILTKSSIMVGLGERRDQVVQAMLDLRSVGVDILTIGQYLRPSEWHLPVAEYVAPSVFEEYEACGDEIGFLLTVSGPLVRSSYKAGEVFVEGYRRKKNNATTVAT